MLSLKLSLLLLYLRIFSIDRITRYLTYVGMAFCCLAYTILMFLDIFSTFQMIVNTNKALGVVNFCSDIYILCVPVAAVSKLQLSAKNRIGVVFVFVTGFMYGISCCEGPRHSANIITAHVRWVWQALYFDSNLMDRKQIPPIC